MFCWGFGLPCTYYKCDKAWLIAGVQDTRICIMLTTCPCPGVTNGYNENRLRIGPYCNQSQCLHCFSNVARVLHIQSLLFCRAHHVCHCFQYGAHRFPSVQDWGPAHGFALRRGQHEDHDPDGHRCPERSGQRRVCQMPPFGWLPVTTEKYVNFRILKSSSFPCSCARARAASQSSLLTHAIWVLQNLWWTTGRATPIWPSLLIFRTTERLCPLEAATEETPCWGKSASRSESPAELPKRRDGWLSTCW